jgi:molybdopterin biosynthesis enzyme
VAFELCVRPAIWKLAGRRRLDPARLEVTLAGALPAAADRTHIQPVWVEASPEGVMAIPLDLRKAPDLPPQMLANGLVRRPPGSPAGQAGQRVWVDLIETF